MSCPKRRPGKCKNLPCVNSTGHNRASGYSAVRAGGREGEKRMNVFYCRRAVDLGEERCRVASRQARRTYALAEAKPHFAPDRPCDIVHIALTLHLDIAQQTIKGTCAT